MSSEICDRQMTAPHSVTGLLSIPNDGVSMP